MVSLPSDFKCKFCCCWRFRIWRNTCVFLVFFVPFDNLSLIRKFHYKLWRAANFDLCLALLVIERWGFLSVPHLLWYGTYVYNGHLQWHSNLLPSDWRGNCYYLFLRLMPVAAGIRTPNLQLPGWTHLPNAPTLRTFIF